jgi:hypothetical protein
MSESCIRCRSRRSRRKRPFHDFQRTLKTGPRQRVRHVDERAYFHIDQTIVRRTCNQSFIGLAHGFVLLPHRNETCDYLPANAAGKYELEIKVTDKRTGKQDSVKLPLTVNPIARVSFANAGRQVEGDK